MVMSYQRLNDSGSCMVSILLHPGMKMSCVCSASVVHHAENSINRTDDMELKAGIFCMNTCDSFMLTEIICFCFATCQEGCS